MRQRGLLLFLLLTSLICRADVPHVLVDLVAEVDSVTPGSSFTVLFRQTIDDGWHTYWINPGDSGDAPSINWEPSEGVTIGDFDWPYPERIPYGPLMNFGYHDEVLLPFEVRVHEDFAGSSLRIKGAGRVLVCADICIPQPVSVDLLLPVGAGELNAESKGLFDRARSLIPTEVKLPGEVVVRESDIVLSFPLPVTSADRIDRIEYFPYALDLIDNAAEQVFNVSEQGLSLSLQKGFGFDEAENLDFSGVIVVEEQSGEETVLSSFTVVAGEGGSVSVDSSTPDMSILLAVLFAFLGGLILNLMPCVFPVLSIKILSLVESVHGDNQSLQLHGWVYALGVVLSFVGIALLLIVLRLGGEAIGWGFQLQSPFVVAALVYLFFLIALNLLGVFEVGTSVMSLGASGPSTGYVGSFATGVLATVVAAPCTAPFMGAAVGFALTQSTAVSLLIFGSLGFGMALPYVLLCYSPALLARMPAPGSWMRILKEVMAFPMFASAIWLLWVLGLQTGPTGMMQVLAGVLLLGLAIWLFNERKQLARVIGVLSILSAAYLVVQLETPQAPSPELAAGPTDDPQAQSFRSYDRQALLEAVRGGPVFVNFTAAWCITCKVNEVNALNTSPVQEAMAASRVTYFKADWTSEDPAITAALAEYGRSGVPLYLLYRQGAERAEVLPQLLTQGIVLDALGRL